MDKPNNIFSKLGVDVMYVLYIALGLRVVALFTFLVSHKISRCFFFVEGLYLVMIASIPLQLGQARNSFAFLGLMLWILAYYTDFLISWLYLNAVSGTIYFVIIPIVYQKDEEYLTRILYMMLLNLILFVIESTTVYIEKLQL